MNRDSFERKTPLGEVYRARETQLTARAPFPAFASHDEASCFNCGGDFGPDPYFSLSGFPVGRGAYVVHCEKCRMSTWCDVEAETAR